MHSDSIRDSTPSIPNVVLGSEGPSPMQEATTPNENAGPHANTRGVGQGRVVAQVNPCVSRLLLHEE
jgi:hypothetical protein